MAESSSSRRRQPAAEPNQEWRADTQGNTLAGLLATQLRMAVLSGEIGPGTKLRLDKLRLQYGVSLSPLREALSRLAAEGFVVGEAQRGYRVAPVSQDNLREVTFLRSQFEALALRESIRKGGDDWEASLVAAFHRLQKLDQRDRNARWLDDWERAHRSFHTVLIEACGMPLLLQCCATVDDLSDRYRRLFLERNPLDRDVAGEHKAIVEAALAHDAERACALLQQHIERTGEMVLAEIVDGGRRSAAGKRPARKPASAARKTKNKR